MLIDVVEDRVIVNYERIPSAAGYEVFGYFPAHFPQVLIRQEHETFGQRFAPGVVPEIWTIEDRQQKCSVYSKNNQGKQK
jgi:hypothetical protein